MFSIIIRQEKSPNSASGLAILSVAHPLPPNCCWVLYSCCPSPDWLPVAFQAPIEFQSFKDFHVATLLLLEQKGGLPDIGTSAGRFSLGDLVLRPVLISVLT